MIACGLSAGNHQSIPRGEIRVAHVDVRLGDALKHARRRAGLIGHRHQRDLLLLDDPESAVAEALACRRQVFVSTWTTPLISM